MTANDASRAPAGGGSVFQTTNGGKACWCASYSLTAADGRRIFVRGYGATQREAIARRQANLQRRMRQGFQSRPACPTISAYLKVWLESVSEDKQNPTTRARNAQNIQDHVLPYLDEPLTSVTSDEVEKLFTRTLPQQGVGGFAIYHAYASLRAMYNYARKHKVIPPDCDPLKPVEVRKPTPAVRENDDKYVDRRLSITRYMLAWLAQPTCPYHHLYARTLFLFLGLRRAELLGLAWDCVSNLEKKNRASITIKRQLMRGEGSGWELVERTKTKETRVIPLPETHRRALLELKKQRPSETQEEWQQELVFLTETKLGWRHVTYNEHNSDWRTVLTAYYQKDGRKKPLDETEYFRPHTARRLCVSLLAEAGVPFEVAKDILGHKTVKMTDYYNSVTKQARREAATALDSTLRPKRRK